MKKIKNVEFIKSVFNSKDLPEKLFPEIVFSGKSNVGKSSLINTILNKKNFAKTSSTPGRTQSLNYFLINDNLYFVDLPGYGYAKVPIKIKNSWNKLLDDYLNCNNNIKLIVQLLDFRHKPTSDDMDMINWLKYSGKNFIIVFTKCDKIGKSKKLAQQKKLTEYIEIDIEQTVLFSAVKKIGVEKLINFILEE
jgi:GTP-binding protein